MVAKVITSGNPRHCKALSTLSRNKKRFFSAFCLNLTFKSNIPINHVLFIHLEIRIIGAEFRR